MNRKLPRVHLRFSERAPARGASSPWLDPAPNGIILAARGIPDMRAAVLLLPLIAAAAVAVASAPPGYGPEGDYNTAMTMDTNAADMNLLDYNVVQSAFAPAWIADG